jgi:hypothetical protein
MVFVTVWSSYVEKPDRQELVLSRRSNACHVQSSFFSPRRSSLHGGDPSSPKPWFGCIFPSGEFYFEGSLLGVKAVVDEDLRNGRATTSGSAPKRSRYLLSSNLLSSPPSLVKSLHYRALSTPYLSRQTHSESERILLDGLRALPRRSLRRAFSWSDYDYVTIERYVRFRAKRLSP